jgi:hypothetical protein
MKKKQKDFKEQIKENRWGKHRKEMLPGIFEGAPVEIMGEPFLHQ